MLSIGPLSTKVELFTSCVCMCLCAWFSGTFVSLVLLDINYCVQ